MMEELTELRDLPHVVSFDRAENKSNQEVRDDQCCVVLIVDDNQDSADSLALFVSMLGHDAYVVYDGQRAIDITQTFVPDLILLDLVMPGLDGFDVLSVLRSSKLLERTAIVAMTGYFGDDVISRSLAAGFDDHLTKPIDAVLLEQLLQQQCEKNRIEVAH
jgi:CheY-like chemotaxis protein